jgi:hypothetical protein
MSCRKNRRTAADSAEYDNPVAARGRRTVKE